MAIAFICGSRAERAAASRVGVFRDRGTGGANGLLGVLEGLLGMFQRLARTLVGAEMIASLVTGRGHAVSLGRQLVHFSRFHIRRNWHISIASLREPKSAG